MTKNHATLDHFLRCIRAMEDLCGVTEIDREMAKVKKEVFLNRLAMLARQDAYWRLHGGKPW